MCGIFGYLNYLSPKKRGEIIAQLIVGLKRLEYRGYDSAGVAVDGREGASIILKHVGQVSVLEGVVAKAEADGVLNLDDVIETHAAIAHTRWATHGRPCNANAHPHTSDAHHDFIVVHNGMITNWDVLKRVLLDDGVHFESETDTEVIAKWLKKVYDEATQGGTQPAPTFCELINEIASTMTGAYALLVKSRHYPGELVACKVGSPLAVGFRSPQNVGSPRGQRASPTNGVAGGGAMEGVPVAKPASDGGGSHEFFFASDVGAFVGLASSVVHLEDGDIVSCRDGVLNYFEMTHLGGEGGEVTAMRKKLPQVDKLEMKIEQVMKGSYPHFMLKEIYEQSESLVNTMRGRMPLDLETGTPEHPADHVHLGGLVEYLPTLRSARRFIMFACGTSYHATVAARIVIEELTGTPVQLELASDFQDRRAPIFRDDVCCFLSQSGETKDTIDALKYCLHKGALCVGFTNTVGSYVSRKTHCGVHINCGPEIGVASTKAYTSQIVCLLMFGLLVSEDKRSQTRRREHIIRGLKAIPALVAATLESTVGIVKDVAAEYRDARSMLVMGRGFELATCMEGALKIKELSYIHSEGLHTGELKHGPLALVDENLPVIMVCTDDMQFESEPSQELYSKVKSSLQQVRSRSGRPIVITNVEDKDVEEHAHKVIRVPKVLDCLQPIINIIPLQLLSYHLATLRGHDVDKPRNLAKSVTTN